MSDTIVTAPLSQGAGYGVVIGLGALFAIGMIAISNALHKHGVADDAEEFTGKSKRPTRQVSDLSRKTIREHGLDCRGSHLFLDVEVSPTYQRRLQAALLCSAVALLPIPMVSRGLSSTAHATVHRL